MFRAGAGRSDRSRRVSASGDPPQWVGSRGRELRVAARDARFPHHRGAAAVQGGALGEHSVAELNRGEEIGLAFDGGRAGVPRQVGGCRRAAEHIGSSRAGVEIARPDGTLIGLYRAWRYN